MWRANLLEPRFAELMTTYLFVSVGVILGSSVSLGALNSW